MQKAESNVGKTQPRAAAVNLIEPKIEPQPSSRPSKAVNGGSLMDEPNPLQKEVEMMNLEKLISEREGISRRPFSIPVRELLARYEKLYTGAINDVLREFCLLEQALPHDIVPLRNEDTVAGIAFTVKSAPSCIVNGEMSYRVKMLDDMTEDAFIVWDTTRDEQATLWGGVMTATAKRKGVRAACIDGGIRDTHQIFEQNFPVYYRYRISNGSLGRCQITSYQTPIKIGDVTIKPGDVIFADIDGVLCVPRDIACEVLLRAETIKGNEKRIFGWIAEGTSLDEITANGGYF